MSGAYDVQHLIKLTKREKKAIIVERIKITEGVSLDRYQKVP